MWGTLRGVVLPSVLGVVVVIATAGAGVAAGPTATDTATHPGAGDTSAAEPPLADAGLDQTVPRETTVYLDGGGSVAPDGEIADYDWEITRPDNSTTSPTCLTDECVRATFLPSQVGVYSVTLTVTDDEDRTAQDTLYVTVTDKEPPSATVTGPDELLVGESGTFELDGTAGDAPLSSITWLVDGDRHAGSFVDGPGEWDTTLSFGEPGTYTVTGKLTDVIGLTDRDSHTVTVEPEDDGGDDEDDEDEEADEEDPYFAVTITDTNSPVPPGETLTVDATVENTGGATDTQSVTLGAEFANDSSTEVGPLGPGESTELTGSFDTGGVDPGQYEVTVESDDDTDSRLIRVGTGATVEVTDIVPAEVDDPEQAYEFYVQVENTGTVTSDAYIALYLAGDGSFLGDIILTDGIDPGEEVVPVRPISWHSRPSGGGWHDYDGESVDLRATTDTWDGDYRKTVDVPQLPTFELDIRGSNVRTIPSQSESPVGQVAVLDALVTNVGDLPGDATARLELLGSEAGDSTGMKDETGATIEPGESYVIDQYERGENELYYNPSTDAEWEDDVEFEVDVHDDLGGVHDSETFDLSWSRSPPSGGSDNPCEAGPQLNVETEPQTAVEGNFVEYDVLLKECIDEEEGLINERELSPSEYSVEYAPQSPGPEEYMNLRPTAEAVTANIPSHVSRDQVEFGWRAEHYGSDASGHGGAIWFRSG